LDLGSNFTFPGTVCGTAPDPSSDFLKNVELLIFQLELEPNYQKINQTLAHFLTLKVGIISDLFWIFNFFFSVA